MPCEGTMFTSDEWLKYGVERLETEDVVICRCSVTSEKKISQ